MPVYRVSGFAFRSSVVFPELAAVRGAVPHARFAWALAARRGWRARRWDHRWRAPDGRDWARFARVREGYLVRFPHLADFLVSSDARAVRCAPRQGVSPETVRHLFLHQVLPLLMGGRGYLVLHASAVATPAGAVAFVGAAGCGKSTLAASFWLGGFPLVADDSVRLDLRDGSLVAVPSYPGLRLSARTARRLSAGPLPPDRSGSAKVLIAVDRRGSFARTPVRLLRLYLLGPALPSTSATSVHIEPVSRRETLAALVAHLFRLGPGVDRRDVLARDFDRLATAAARVAARRLRLRRGLPHLPEVKAAILADLGVASADP